MRRATSLVDRDKVLAILPMITPTFAADARLSTGRASLPAIITTYMMYGHWHTPH